MDANDLTLMEDSARDLFKLTETYQKENAALRKEVAHLKELLTFTAPLITKEVKIEVTKEQAACEIQLQMLNVKAHDRELTLEETKRLEILIKSLYLIKDKATTIGITGTEGLSVESLLKQAEDGPHPTN